jgi:hypothetical protein
MADSQFAEVARRLLLVALSWMVVAGWAGAAGNLAGRDAPAFGDITFFVGSDLHYGYNHNSSTNPSADKNAGLIPACRFQHGSRTSPKSS